MSKEEKTQRNMNFLKKLFGTSNEANAQNPENGQEKNEKNFDILKYDGVKAMKLHQYDYAVECFRHALGIKDDLEIHDYLSQVFLALGDLRKAYEELQKLAEAQPDNINIFIRMAHVAYMMEDYVVMCSVCEKALLIENDSPVALYLYAKACVGTDDVTNAVAMLTKAISVKPDYADAYLLRGEVLLKDERLDEADVDALHLLEEYPENEDILMLKANIELARKNASVAIEWLNKVIDANPFNVSAYKLRGEQKQSLGDAVGAKEDYEQALELLNQQTGGFDKGIEEKTKERYSQTGVF